MAVERLTDYTRRIWTGLGPDDPAVHDIQVNDVIYYMDSSECCIVTNVHPDGSIDCETLPDVGGGGGGGDDPYVIGRAILENNITEYIDPELTYLKSGSMQNCTTLRTFKAPALVQMSPSALQGTTALGPIAFPSLTRLAPNNGQYCLAGTHAPVIDFGPNFQVTIANYHMQNATTSTLIYRKNGIVTLQATHSMPLPFQNSGTGGTLYVPSSRISGYQAATNWSVMLAYDNNQILPIEGSIYETQYADGTPIP